MSDLYKTVDEIVDLETIRLIEELATIAQLDLKQGRGMQLFHYLQQALYPNGAAEKAVPIDKKDLDAADPLDSFVLRKKISSLGDKLHATCAAIPFAVNEGIENLHATSLYVFLNKALVLKKKPKPKFKRYYW